MPPNFQLFSCATPRQWLLGFTRLAQTFHEGQKHATVLTASMREFFSKQPPTSQPSSLRVVCKTALTSHWLRFMDVK